MAVANNGKGTGVNMYDNHWFERSRVSRLYSSVTASDKLHAQSELMGDFGRFAIDFVNSCNVDRRNVATSSDGELFKYDLIAANAGNENWANSIWVTLAISRLVALLGDIGTPDNPQKVLCDPVTSIPDIINSPNCPEQDLFFFNNSDFCMVELFLQQTPHVADFSQLRYSVIDTSELLDGSLDNTFDLVRTYSRESIFSTTTFIKKLMDSIKVGGRLSISTIADYTNMYRDSLRSHENDFSILNKYLANRTDFEIMHVPVEFGFAIGKRVA